MDKFTEQEKKKPIICPRCGHVLIKEYLDGHSGTTYLAWVCTYCGYEKRA